MGIIPLRARFIQQHHGKCLTIGWFCYIIKIVIFEEN